LGTEIKMLNTCVFGLDIESKTLIQKDFKTNVQIGSGCNFRISFNTSSQLKNIEAEILEKGGLLWRL
jgi:hypothetical protein